MSPQEASAGILQKGPIAWMTKNSVAANLLMGVILAGGLFGIYRTKQEVFPAFTLDLVQIGVPYPGASPTEVEQGITRAVEEAVRGLDGVKRVTSSSIEGAGAVSVELLLGTDTIKALGDVKDAVDRITSFPEDAERATVSLASRKRSVISFILAGDVPLRELHVLADRMRNNLLESKDITQVEIIGLPPVEMSIEIPRETLESYGWTPQSVAQQIRLASLELPAGEIESASGEFLLRVSDRKKSAGDYADIVLKSSAQGAQIRLGDVATLKDGYADNDVSSKFNGKNAIRVTAYRTGDETPTKVSMAARDVLETFQGELPASVKAIVWDDRSEMLRARIDLLYNNALMGLVLVLIILALFLEIRLAFWVALGIPISFMGAFLLMPGTGQSINMVSLFAFIVTLGMVVDDAIIVGEHAYSKIQEGLEPLDAAIKGAQEMAVPVTFAVLTTLAAFSPLFFVPGTTGKIFRVIPMVVLSVLAFSVIESFFILPAHIAHMKKKQSGFIHDLTNPLLSRTSAALSWFREHIYAPTLDAALSFRYITVSIACMLFIFSVALVGSGVVPFNFFPKLEGDQVTSTVTLPYGAPESLSNEARIALEGAAKQARDEIGADKVRGIFTRVGQAGGGGGGPGGRGSSTGSHLLSIEVSLVPSAEREFSAEDFSTKWKSLLPDLAGVQSIVFNSSTGPGGGTPVDVQLVHTDTEVLARASRDVEEALRTYTELSDVENGYSSGKPQLSFRLLDEARNLGLTSNDVARQLRSFVYGAEALRDQRERDEVKVIVRLPKRQRKSESDLDALRIRTPRGGLVPLRNVAALERGRAPTTIKREAGKRIVNVTAQLAAGVPSPRPVITSLKADVLPKIKKKYPGLSAKFVGSQRNQNESLKSLGQNFFFALFVIYALLAIPFKSYIQPAIVMAAIPFGFVGAIAGHMLMGFEMSIISAMGVIALSGVVVNDSLVLIDAANRARNEGLDARAAVIFGGKKRMRPILLTSLTTFFGLMPMIFETSMQARFLIPMAISLGFGVLFATFIALLVVPSLYLIVEDFLSLVRGKEKDAPTNERPIVSTVPVKP